MSVTIGALRESAPRETRVCLVPEVADKLVRDGTRVLIERGAGVRASFPDSLYKSVAWADSAAGVLSGSDVILTVQPLTVEQIQQLKPGAVVIGFMQPHARAAEVRALKARGVTSFAMELVPRISRAQSMDALSSQASIAGYKAVLIAASQLQKFLPMLTTAAGTIRPSQLLVIGAGVAGLQAIATARRLGAVVEAYDVRSATREQVKSLGAKFVDTGPRRMPWSRPHRSPGVRRRKSSRAPRSSACAPGPWWSTSPPSRAATASSPGRARCSSTGG